MTNKDKLDKILDYISEYTTNASRKVNSDDMPSAKWIYAKGQSDAAKRIENVINDIVNM